MGACDIIIVCVIAAAFIAVIGTVIYKKIKGKGGGCGCGCEGCPHACHCKSNAEEKKN